MPYYNATLKRHQTRRSTCSLSHLDIHGMAEFGVELQTSIYRLTFYSVHNRSLSYHFGNGWLLLFMLYCPIFVMSLLYFVLWCLVIDINFGNFEMEGRNRPVMVRITHQDGLEEQGNKHLFHVRGTKTKTDENWYQSVENNVDIQCWIYKGRYTVLNIRRKI